MLLRDHGLKLFLLITAAQQLMGGTPEQNAFFDTRIRPVLSRQCYACHSGKADKLRGGLRLDTRAGLQRGGESGPAVVPGDLMSSLMISALRWHDEDRGMPPRSRGGRLSDEVIADFERWILMGAPDPRHD